jgi:hypothetical protein
LAVWFPDRRSFLSSHANPEPFEVHYDGQRDDRGFIPAFGPVRLDEQGRIVMSREERQARSAAAVRALEAIEQLPDDDPPGTEEQFMRNF